VPDADHLILGGGPAGSRAAQAIRKRDPRSRIVLVTEEPHPFPNRILLSKEFLTDDGLPAERAVVVPPAAFERLGIELHVGRRVARLDPEARTVDLADGERFAWERCLVATGSRPLALSVPGFGLPGVHVLRTVADALAIRSAARHAERAVVIGGGLIGAEVACALAARGIGVRLVAREPWLWGHLAPEPVGRVAGGILTRGGIGLLPDRTVVAIHAQGPELAVETAEGDALVAPLVVAGVGVRPNSDFLAGTDLLDPGGGILTSARLETGAPSLWAAGDVAAFDDPVFGARHRVEHWLHAQHQGRQAGENMTGEPRAYARASGYDTHLFDVPVMVVGAPALSGRWTVEEPFLGDSGTALGWREERLVAAYRIGGGSVDAFARRIEAGASTVG
jgi:NADPH-dependent 2,4-dienoyl-CoA reductase/sulfur reductase-like enzyme